ncbi:efflux RND transporter periplasmic adaptor subunit [Curvibacter gracilis]|uniref:efflux RND transporter periplasmic adaptor subunit n=1 Tax=Curvibacter gracilis TaxID=230310 RepID=UPI000481D140|nr:efflux RND transporter periplasmic adaptor subunit [Curvibacter gracilis]
MSIKLRPLVTLALSLGMAATLPIGAASPAALKSVPVAAVAGGAQGTALDAVVEAGRQTVIAAQVQGAIVALPVKAGQAVRAGQLLVRLDARAAQSGVDVSQAQLEAARALAAQAQREHQRQQALFEQQYVSQAALERSLAALRAAQAQVRATAAQTTAAHTQSGYYSVSAPYAGVISELPVSLGDLASPGRPLLTLFDPASLRLSVQVPESLAAGQGSVRVQVDGLPAFELPQGQWLPAVDPVSHTRTLRLTLPAEMSAALAPGRFARVWLPGRVLSAAPARLLVPQAAVLRRAELQAVYVITAEGRPVLRQVRLGEARGDQVEVLTGLREGESVALDPQAAAAQVR